MSRYPHEDSDRARSHEDDRHDEYRDELAAERHRRSRWHCFDRRCGALDCRTCHPENCEDPDD